MLPTFLVIGAMRAGTTTLYNHLRAHPEIFMPQLKEPAFFAKNWDRGIAWYESLFAPAGSAIAIGEASTTYTGMQVKRGVPARIAATLPDVRLIYLIRHPVERLVSQFHYSRVHGFVGKRIDHAVLQEDFLLRSMYAFHIDQYLQHFDRDRLLVLTTEDLNARPAETLARAYEFVGVERSWVPRESGDVFHRREEIRPPRPTVTALKRSRLYRAWTFAVPESVRRRLHGLTTRKHSEDPRLITMSPATRAEVIERLRPDLIRLRQLMGPTFSCWGLLEPETLEPEGSAPQGGVGGRAGSP